MAGTLGTRIWSSETRVPFVPGRRTRLLLVSMARHVGFALAGCTGAAAGASRTVAAICAKVIEAAGVLVEVAGAGLGRDGDGARERRWGAAEGALELGLAGSSVSEVTRFLVVVGVGVGGRVKIAGPAARTVSMAVDMAVCMGILGRAVTVAATMFAM